MKGEPIIVLLVEDEPAHVEAVRRAFKAFGNSAEIRVAKTLREFRAAVALDSPDIAILDLNLPDGNALEVLAERRESRSFPILIMTSSGNESKAVETMKAGVLDYIVKSTEAFIEMPHTVDRALREWDLLQDGKKTEITLQENEEKYRTLVENAAEAILITQDGMLKFVNRMASEITGYSEQELRSSPFLEFIYPEDRDMVGERYLKRLKCDVSQPRYAFRLINKNGSIKWVEIGAVVIAWEGKPATLSFLSDITEKKKAEDKLRETLGSLRNALGGIIQVLSAMTEQRDPYTAGHQRRVADLARAIGQEMGLPADRVEGLHMAGAIHDIGKVSIPAEILSNPTRLTNIEYNLIQFHVQAGHDILDNIDFSWPIAKMILQHHERINGSGYPNQLKGEEILLEARILAVSDVVEAMASHRPYRPALGIEAALEEIEKNKGVFYDPDVVSACLTLFREKGFEFKLESRRPLGVRA